MVLAESREDMLWYWTTEFDKAKKVLNSYELREKQRFFYTDRGLQSDEISRLWCKR